MSIKLKTQAPNYLRRGGVDIGCFRCSLFYFRHQPPMSCTSRSGRTVRKTLKMIAILNVILWTLHYGMVSAFVAPAGTGGWLTTPTMDGPGQSSRFCTAVAMAKKMRNKQADLAKKMALAKEQNAQKQSVYTPETKKEERLSDEEMKEQNDRRRFEELLKTQAVSLGDISSENYLTQQQEEEIIDAYREYKFLRFGSGSCLSLIRNYFVPLLNEKNVDWIGSLRVTQHRLNRLKSWST